MSFRCESRCANATVPAFLLETLSSDNDRDLCEKIILVTLSSALLSFVTHNQRLISAQSENRGSSKDYSFPAMGENFFSIPISPRLSAAARSSLFMRLRLVFPVEGGKNEREAFRPSRYWNSAWKARVRSPRVIACALSLSLFPFFPSPLASYYFSFPFLRQ